MRRVSVLLLLAVAACGSRTGMRGGDPTPEAPFEVPTTPAPTTPSPTPTGPTPQPPAPCLDVAPMVEEESALDLFLLLDVSGSMGLKTTAGVQKLTAVKQALTQFFEKSAVKGARAALSRFPFPEEEKLCKKSSDCGGAPCLTWGTCGDDANAMCWSSLQCPKGVACTVKATCQLSADICATDADCPSGAGECYADGSCEGPDTCKATSYADPILPLTPFDAPELAAALASLEPKGGTPTLPAYEGTSKLARAHAKTVPTARTLIVVVTDGIPSSCGSTYPLDGEAVQADIDAFAKLALGESVPTFAVGIFGKKEEAQALDGLTSLTKAGGTEKPFILSPEGDLSGSFVAAMDALIKSTLACSIPLPDLGGQVLDPSSVEVAIGAQKLTHVAGSGACTGDGFYLNSDVAPGATPSKVFLCTEACTSLPVKIGVSVKGTCG